ncbi:hypothetical protein BG004_004094 [Podila humilis]|nr:hypothetical protein BG004_004094 [Podila humilis]
MGDITSSSTSASTLSTSASNPQGASASSKSSVKLNPEAKDYIPRSATVAEGSASNQSLGSSNSNRRRRNPKSKSGIIVNSESSASTQSENTIKGVGNNNSSSSSSSNRNRRNNRHPRSTTARNAAARIDDDDDDIEIIMDKPLDSPSATPFLSQPSHLLSVSTASSTAKSGAGAANTDGRREGRQGRRKGNEMATDSQTRRREGGDNTRTRASQDRQPEDSVGRNNNSHASGSNRRQRNRKGDLGGRTFPTNATSILGAGDAGGSERITETSRPQRISTPKARPSPKKFVHTVEEDRDLMAALTAGLTESTYDCMVCWDIIRPAHKTWNCQVCWAAFHLDCISTWAKKSSEGTWFASSAISFWLVSHSLQAFADNGTLSHDDSQTQVSPQQGGAALDVKTSKCRFQESTIVSVERQSTQISIGTSLPILVASSVAAQETAHTLAICKYT